MVAYPISQARSDAVELLSLLSSLPPLLQSTYLSHVTPAMSTSCSTAEQLNNALRDAAAAKESVLLRSLPRAQQLAVDRLAQHNKATPIDVNHTASYTLFMYTIYHRRCCGGNCDCACGCRVVLNVPYLNSSSSMLVSLPRTYSDNRAALRFTHTPPTTTAQSTTQPLHSHPSVRCRV